MSTAAQQRVHYAARKEAGLCTNAASHGPATHGTECEACWKRRADKRHAVEELKAEFRALRNEIDSLRREVATQRTEMDVIRRSLDVVRFKLKRGRL